MNLITHRGETYEYVETESGLKLFSVTQVRKVAYDHYARIPLQQLENARKRGNLLHRRMFFAIATQGGKCPTWPIVLPGLAGYCESMDRWVREHNVRPVKLEHRSLNRRYGYAGQIDGQVLYGEKDLLTLMDLKTGEPTITDPMQVVAYDHMEELKSRSLLLLYLDKDGGPARERWIKPGERPGHWAVFLNALSLLRWRVSHGSY